MSKKTKQEKIIADLRRKLTLQQIRASTIPAKEFYSPSAPVHPPEEKTTPTATTASFDFGTPRVDLIKKDLTKTLLLSILAISLELVLYFLLRQA